MISPWILLVPWCLCDVSQTRLNGSASSLTCEDGKSFLLMNINILIESTDCLPYCTANSSRRCLVTSCCPATAMCPQTCPSAPASLGTTRMLLSLSGLPLSPGVGHPRCPSSLGSAGLVAVSTVVPSARRRGFCPSFTEARPLTRVVAEVWREGRVSEGRRVYSCPASPNEKRWQGAGGDGVAASRRDSTAI